MDGIETDAINSAAKTQLDYALGSSGRSYVCGFGTNPPLQPHHRAASCEDLPAPCNVNDLIKTDDNPQVEKCLAERF